ncbi:MAG: hypothetical protein LBD13_01180 [Spirochaetaceae bacterium]|jgi:hypothetical protein|nr:hypothetical protein [Spirochaetaceae bacterium]
MKKLLTFSIVLGVVCGTLAFAQEEAKSGVTINAEAYAALVPLQIVHNPDRDDPYVGAGLGGWADGNVPLVRLDVKGNFEDKIGFRAHLDFLRGDAGVFEKFTVGDFLGLWWQPLPQLKFDVGRFNEDILRGKVGDDDWHNFTVGMKGKDAIFTRFKGDAGVLVSIKPLEGLFIGVHVPDFSPLVGDTPNYTSGAPDLNGDTVPVTNAGDDKYRALRVYERTQVAVGYELSGIGLVRAQFVGANGDGTDFIAASQTPPVFNNAPRIEAAFAYTGMENLVIDFGLKFWIPIGDTVTDAWSETDHEYTMTGAKGTFWKGMQIALGAGYTMGAIGINARIDVGFLENYKYDNAGLEVNIDYPFWLNFHLWPSYDLGFATIGLDFGLGVNGDGKAKVKTGAGTTETEAKGGIDVGFGLWIQKAIGNGSIRGGVAYKVATENPENVKQNGILSIPILFGYAF